MKERIREICRQLEYEMYMPRERRVRLVAELRKLAGTLGIRLDEQRLSCGDK